MQIVKKYRPDEWRLATKTVTFTGAAGAGAVGTVALATVTGRVMARVLPAYCTTLLAGDTATLRCGVANDLDAFIAQATATDIDTDTWWVNSTAIAGAVSPVQLDNGGAQIEQDEKLVASDIILTVATAAITAGVLEIYILWRPLSSDGNVTPA